MSRQATAGSGHRPRRCGWAGPVPSTCHLPGRRLPFPRHGRGSGAWAPACAPHCPVAPRGAHGPRLAREWGTTLAMWLTLIVVMLVVCGGVESMRALTPMVLPWEPPIETASLCSRQGGLFAAVDVGAGAAGFAVLNGAIRTGLDVCVLTLSAILRGERPQAVPEVSDPVSPTHR